MRLDTVMDRAEKLRLSADTTYCCCFRQGIFARFYEQVLYWFCFAIKPLKPMHERVKSGEPIIYGGLPIDSFEKMLAEGAPLQVEATEYGWRWPYAGQNSLPEDCPGFAQWRASIPAETLKNSTSLPAGKNILAELAAFNLAAHTPMQAMTAIADWQAHLRNREGTG
jgi:hypothetical protein